MTPRERILTALRHEPPPHGGRVPFSWNFGPTAEMSDVLADYLVGCGVDWLALRDEVDDIRGVAPPYVGPELPPDTDIWGIRRRSQSYGTGSYNEIVHYPLAGLTDPAALDDVPWPDPSAHDFAGFRERVLDEVRGPRGEPRYRAAKLSISMCGNPFEIYCWMTGLEESLVNVLLNPELVRAALDGSPATSPPRWPLALAEVADLVDILYFADDLGGQRKLLMSRRTYREVLMPSHATAL